MLPERLAEIFSLPVDDRIEVVSAIWDSIAADSTQPGLTDSQRQELARCVADHLANPSDVIPWEQVKAQALARART